MHYHQQLQLNQLHYTLSAAVATKPIALSAAVTTKPIALCIIISSCDLNKSKCYCLLVQAPELLDFSVELHC